MVALVNSGGTLQASYIYDPYGRYLTGTGTLLTSNVMRFSSKPWVSFLSSSATSGLYYYGYRFYDTYLQRWVNRDLLEEFGGRNLYLSLANDPANTIDASGLSWYHWVAVFNVISCFKEQPGESASDYFSVPPVSCEECARDKDLAERRCKNGVDELAIKYSGNLVTPAIATGIQDLFLLGLGFYAPPAWGLFVVSGIGTACEVKAIHDIEKSAKAYKEMYCECPDFDESE
ncbi:MAG: RHS repeat-associated core domain-containing protein [Verrucomicrobia bacterium]|nr:RHS repeat-associated core domain-containing protein [Verrucomicrobiota bacterium]